MVVGNQSEKSMPPFILLPNTMKNNHRRPNISPIHANDSSQKKRLRNHQGMTTVSIARFEMD